MTYESLAVLLMIVGFALIVAEVFIPSGGMILILCVISFVSSIWCAHKAWWVEQPGLFWAYIGALVVLIPSTVIGAFRFLEQSAVGKRVILAAPAQHEVVPHQEKVSQLTALIGLRGTALTLMTPGGMVQVHGQRLHAETEGLLIDPETPIEVIGVKGTRVLVRAAERPEESVAQPAESSRSDVVSSSTAAAEPAAPLDFDIPQG
jgi:membrane-bound serine protease (ClpP class)